MRKHILMLTVATIALMIAFIVGGCSGDNVEETQATPLRNSSGTTTERIEWDICVVYGKAAREYAAAAKTIDAAAQYPSEFTWRTAAWALENLSNELDRAVSRIGEQATDAAASALAKGDIYLARVDTINASAQGYRDFASDILDRMERRLREPELGNVYAELFADLAYAFHARADEMRSAVKRAIASDYCEGY